jgi:hypothetical protein
MLRWLRERRIHKSDQAPLLAQIKSRIRVSFALDEADTVVVNEIACPDPGCPDLETVILIMRPGRKTQAVKIAGPLSQVSDSDLVRAAAGST